MLRLGIDVGGTNTDAVIVSQAGEVLGAVKTPTTEDPFDGIANAMSKVLSDSGVEPGEITYAMLGTTHCTNAIVRRRDLNRVGVLRLSLPTGDALAPLAGWPKDLLSAINPMVVQVHGGYEVDGREISQLDEEEIREAVAAMRDAGIESIAVTGVFAPSRDDQERRVAEIIKDVAPGMAVSLSHRIGTLGLVERENSTVLNATLHSVIQGVVSGFQRSLQSAGISAPAYIGQNDGTVMDAATALEYPVLTIGCGPTNSIRGAAALSGLADAVVIDVGGTTSDLGVLVSGFPRQSSLAVTVGEVTTNFRMPDILAIGLGGGSVVFDDAVGPESVGHELLTSGLSWGGGIATVSDAAVAEGLVEITGARPAMPKAKARDVIQRCHRMVAEAVDRMKTSTAPVPVIVVGGGAFVVPDDLDGASRVVRPEHAEVANAIGAALADVSGEHEAVYRLEGLTREEALGDSREVAMRRAIEAGARPDSVEIVDVSDIPMDYMPGNVIRVRTRAVGTLV